MASRCRCSFDRSFFPFLRFISCRIALFLDTQLACRRASDSCSYHIHYCLAVCTVSSSSGVSIDTAIHLLLHTLIFTSSKCMSYSGSLKKEENLKCNKYKRVSLQPINRYESNQQRGLGRRPLVTCLGESPFLGSGTGGDLLCTELPNWGAGI